MKSSETSRDNNNNNNNNNNINILIIIIIIIIVINWVKRTEFLNQGNNTQHFGTITCSRAYNLISDRSMLPHRASEDDYLR